MNWPGGELFALDVGTNMEKDNTYEETQDVETQVIPLIHLPAGLELAKDAWHKVSTNSSVFISAFERGEGLNVSTAMYSRISSNAAESVGLCAPVATW